MNRWVVSFLLYLGNETNNMTQVFIDELFRSLSSVFEQLPHLHSFDIYGEISSSDMYETFKEDPMRFFEASETLQEVRVDHWIWEKGADKEGKFAGMRDPKAWMTVELRDVQEELVKVKDKVGDSGIN